MFDVSHLVLCAAYTGQFCEDDFDGCSEMSCFEGVTCTDNPAPQTGSICGSCPAGFEEESNKCTGALLIACLSFSTCVVVQSVHVAKHLYYFFKMTLYTHILTDVDECAEGSHSCKYLCTNTEGGYFCGCHNGFTWQNDTQSCQGKLKYTLL